MARTVRGEFTSPGSPDIPSLSTATEVLKAGGVVAIPTDTVYGLAARAFYPPAVAGVFRVKGRNSDAPLPLLLADHEMIDQCASSLSDDAMRLAQEFWPGPLTIVVPRSNQVPDVVTGGSATVGLRVPDHPVPRALAAALGEPITGTSANRSGEPAILSHSHLRAELGAEVDCVVDGGDLPVRPASTVVDMTGQVPVVLRAGGVGRESIEEFLGIDIR